MSSVLDFHAFLAAFFYGDIFHVFSFPSHDCRELGRKVWKAENQSSPSQTRIRNSWSETKEHNAGRTWFINIESKIHV